MIRVLLMAALLLPSVAHAQEWEDDADPTSLAQAAAHQARTARLAGTLARDGGARELALAAVLRRAANAPQGSAPDGEAPSQPAPRDPQVDAWLRTAAAKAGDDPIAHQLLVTATPAGLEQRREAARRWQAADPGNLMPLLYADLIADALLAAARNATRANARMYEGVRWIASAWPGIR